MDKLPLTSDEAIIHKTQTLIVNGVRHEAVLTSRRLILVESETGNIREEILFTEIDRAISGVNKLREPYITLVIHPPGGEQRTIELIFIRLFIHRNIVEQEKCIAILKEHAVPVEVKRPLAGSAVLVRKEKTDAGELEVEEEASRPAVPEWTILGSPRNSRHTLPEEPPELSPLTTITAIFLIAVVIIGSMALVGFVLNAQTHPAPQNITAPDVTTEVTLTPAPTPAPTPETQETSVPAESAPAITIPPNGVWVKVQYPGYYSGYIGARGRNIEVNSTGTQWYQVPVVDTTIDGTITKLDGSADKLVVETYKDGTLISRKSTKSPFGLIELLGTGGAEDITADVAPSVVVITPVPIPESQAIEDYLPPISIPATGVWVRIYYPGSFSGTLGGRGVFTPIKGTGDQLYNIPANAGIVEGSVAKDDGSVGRMVTEVYKDGVRLSQMVTATPYGLTDLHVPV
jgi:hypothetical protein